MDLSELSAVTPSAASPSSMVVLRHPDATVREAVPADTLVFGAWEAFAENGADPLGFHLQGFSARDAGAIARRLRQSAWWDRPLCSDATAPLDAAAAASAQHATASARSAPRLNAAAAADLLLVDGWGGFADALAAAERARAARRSLGIDPAALQLDERVLYFLFVRDGCELQPLLDRDFATLYRYPQIDALARAHEDAASWLVTLTRRRLLEPAGLVDRTRHCLGCGGAHLHFLDVCPHCSSIEVSRSPSLHCFSCGHVAPQGHFQADDDGDQLRCPKCSVALRHIGVDYDRPLTQYACGSCQKVFVETAVVARCLDCGSGSEPAELDVREVSRLRLSASGRAALRSGQVQQSYAALENANYVDPTWFRRMLDWALAAQQRHEQMEFGLVLVEFGNVRELIERIGGARVFMLLDEFAGRLHELLRTSDLTTRTHEDSLWLFLPFSSADGLVARLERALGELRSSGGGAHALQVTTRALQLPRDGRKAERAAALMERLRAR